MSNDIIKMISDGIDMVAKKLGIAVDKMYPILMNQAKVDFYKDIVWLCISIVVITLSIITVVLIKKNWKWWNYNDEILILVSILLVVADIVFIIVMICSITEMIQIKANPEWFIFTNYIKPLISK